MNRREGELNLKHSELSRPITSQIQPSTPQPLCQTSTLCFFSFTVTMTQQQHQLEPSIPPPSSLHLAIKCVGEDTSVMQVRCSGCSVILTVTFGVTEFACPSCKLVQMLPQELMTKVIPKPSLPLPPLPHHVASHCIDPTKIQLSCGNCKSFLNVPHGLARFGCPQCGVDLAVDVSMLKQQISSPRPPQLLLSLPSLPLPEDVNEVLLHFVLEFFVYWEFVKMGRKYVEFLDSGSCVLCFSLVIGG